MHVRFGCVSVRRSHANAALHVLSSRHPIKPVHTCSNARVSYLVGYGNRKHESQARCVCAALLSPCLCVQTHLGCNASRSMRCDKSDLQLVRLLANASQRTPFLKTRLIGTQRKMPRVGLHQTHRCTYRNTSSGRWLPINASSARSFQHRTAAVRTRGSTTTHRLHPLFDRQHRTRMRSTLVSSPHTKKRHRFRWRLQSRHDCCVAVVRCLTA